MHCIWCEVSSTATLLWLFSKVLMCRAGACGVAVGKVPVFYLPMAVHALVSAGMVMFVYCALCYVLTEVDRQAKARQLTRQLWRLNVRP